MFDFDKTKEEFVISSINENPKSKAVFDTIKENFEKAGSQIGYETFIVHLHMFLEVSRGNVVNLPDYMAGLSAASAMIQYLCVNTLSKYTDNKG